MLKNLILAMALAIPVLGWAQERVNINTASLDTLVTQLKGIGESRARAIIAYREEHGGFKSVEELAEVHGIGSHVIEINRELLVVTE